MNEDKSLITWERLGDEIIVEICKNQRYEVFLVSICGNPTIESDFTCLCPEGSIDTETIESIYSEVAKGSICGKMERSLSIK
jgi:hypothetical protein